MKKRALPLAALLTVMAVTGTSAYGADLKQLAEQLVNKKQPPRNGNPNPAIREGGRTVGAGQRTAPVRPHHKAGIAIQEEGANVKKEKGVEDVE